MTELLFLQYSGYYAYPEPVIPDYQTEYVEHRAWVPWVKHEWKENNGVRTYTSETDQVNPVIRRAPLDRTPFAAYDEFMKADKLRRGIMHEELMHRNKADIDRINPNSFQNTLRYSF